MSELILGIETSCDDTAVALVDVDGHVVSSYISSQIDVHKEFGGVFPEFAARTHIQTILPTVHATMRAAGITPKDIRAIGVTRGPGLIGSLLVGLNTARGLGLGWQKPVIGINHLRGHLRSAELEGEKVEYPAMVLLVSGGHTLLAYMKTRTEIELLGTTRDDSVGETYDKVGRMIGLDYPAGAAVDKMAKTGKVTIDFPRPMLHKGLEFSFSGLKSAVSRYMGANEVVVREDIAASFVQAAMNVLMVKSRKAMIQYPSKSFVIVGGVSASPQLRSEAQMLCDKLGVKLCLPPTKWSMDNGAMIALATWDYIKEGQLIVANPELRLSICDY